MQALWRFILLQSVKDGIEYYALLAERIRAQDTDAFTEFYHATYNDLYRYAYYFLKDAHLAQDALHEIYILVWRSISSLKENRLFYAWLKQITYHVCCDFQRKHSSVASHETAAAENTEFLLNLPQQEDCGSLTLVFLFIFKKPFV